VVIACGQRIIVLEDAEIPIRNCLFASTSLFSAAVLSINAHRNVNDRKTDLSEALQKFVNTRRKEKLAVIVIGAPVGTPHIDINDGVGDIDQTSRKGWPRSSDATRCNEELGWEIRAERRRSRGGIPRKGKE
jgi:hypothetical protein